jgi:hypothetical protein
MSAYDFAVETADLLPGPDDVDRAIREVEAAYPAPADVQRVIDGWHQPA